MPSIVNGATLFMLALEQKRVESFFVKFLEGSGFCHKIKNISGSVRDIVSKFMSCLTAV